MASRWARLGSSRAEDGPINEISYRDSRLLHAKSAGVDGRPVTLSTPPSRHRAGTRSGITVREQKPARSSALLGWRIGTAHAGVQTGFYG